MLTYLLHTATPHRAESSSFRTSPWKVSMRLCQEILNLEVTLGEVPRHGRVTNAMISRLGHRSSHCPLGNLEESK